MEGQTWPFIRFLCRYRPQGWKNISVGKSYISFNTKVAFKLKFREKNTIKLDLFINENFLQKLHQTFSPSVSGISLVFHEKNELCHFHYI